VLFQAAVLSTGRAAAQAGLAFVCKPDRLTVLNRVIRNARFLN
jgi:hypothetical protein